MAERTRCIDAVADFPCQVFRMHPCVSPRYSNGNARAGTAGLHSYRYTRRKGNTNRYAIFVAAMGAEPGADYSVGQSGQGTFPCIFWATGSFLSHFGG